MAEYTIDISRKIDGLENGGKIEKARVDCQVEGSFSHGREKDLACVFFKKN